MALLTAMLRGWACALAAWAMLLQCALATEGPSEYQVKAVFLFNFSHFVDWPPAAFASPEAPFVIGILGDDPFGSRLDEAVRGEHLAGHPLIVRRFSRLEEVNGCQILFIARSEGAELDRAVGVLDHRSILTVSELDGAAKRGVMVEFVTENNRIRLKIDAEAARSAGLSISSKLLRLADIIGPAGGNAVP